MSVDPSKPEDNSKSTPNDDFDWVPFVLCAGLGVAWLWGTFALEHYFGIDFKFRKLQPGQRPISIWFPSIGTLVTILVAWIWYLRSSNFKSRAVAVAGVITSIGSIALKGWRDVSYRFEFDNQTINGRHSVITQTADKLKVGDSVQVLVDPTNPQKSRLSD